MHMYLDNIAVVHHHDAVADGLQVRPQPQRILLGGVAIFFDQKFRAVAEFNLTGGGGHGAFVRGLYRGNGAAGNGLHHGAFFKHGAHTLENQNQALSTGIYHAGLFQYRQLFRRLCQGFLCGSHGCAAHGPGVVIGGGDLLRRFRCLADHGQNGALRRLHNRFIGCVYALAKGSGHGSAVRFFHAAQRLGKSAKDQRKNDTGVASSAPQQGRGAAGGGFLHRAVFRQHCHFLGGSADRHTHIGAGVAVRHGKNV